VILLRIIDSQPILRRFQSDCFVLNFPIISTPYSFPTIHAVFGFVFFRETPGGQLVPISFSREENYEIGNSFGLSDCFQPHVIVTAKFMIRDFYVAIIKVQKKLK
jgi:hypothetical protein